MSQMQYTLSRVGSVPRLALSRGAGFVAAAYALAVTMLGTTLPTPLYGLYRDRFGISELMVTVVFAAYAAGVGASLLVAGRLSDEIGRRRTLLPGLVFSALSAILFLSANGLAALIAGRVLSGLSAGIFTATATATLLDLRSPERRASATLVASAATMGGLGLGALLAGLLSEFVGGPLELTFWVDLALLVPAVALVWAMPEPVAVHRRARLRVQRPHVPEEMRSVFVRAALAAVAGFAVLGLFSAVVPGFLGQILGIDDRAVVGLVVFAVFAASTLGQIVLQGRFGSHALAAGSGALLVAMVLLAAGLAVSSLGLLVAGGVLGGLGQGVSFRAGLGAVNESAAPQHRAEIASGFFLVAYAAISLPVVGVGLLATTEGLRAAGLIFAFLVALLAASVLVLDTQRKENSR
jgi:predicted MFS family arabinose efflux permease